ncbi:hypothetical protein AKJ16_DCAP05338 [Drosera capensis]
MGVVSVNYLDTMLIPLGLLITTGCHAFLWHKFKKSPSLTAIGINTILSRREWLQGIKEPPPPPPPSPTSPPVCYLIFMNTATAVASAFSCKSGKNSTFFGIFVCLLPKFLGTLVVYVNFLLFAAIDRNPSALNCYKIYV